MSLFRTWTGQSQRSQKSQQSKDVTTDTPSTNSNSRLPHPQRHPSKPNLQPVTSNSSNADPFAGHLNHLTERQEGQFQKFKSTLLEQGLYRPGAQGQPPSHDDQTLLRYLRARKFDINGAYAQFSDTEKWAQENGIAELYENFDVEFYERARRLYPQWTGHRDKRGIPVYVYVVKHLDSKNVNAYAKEAAAYKATLPYHSSLSTPSKMLPLFALYENLLRFTIPLCSSLEGRPNPEVPITNSNNIVDVSGVSLKQFWNLKNHMQESSVLATAHYPETLDRIFVIGAPSYFPTVWGWIKRWFDPVTVKKIFILGHHEVKAKLSEFIDPDDIPKKYGGNLDWDVGMSPHLDQAATEAVERNGSKGWIEGPCLWEQGQRVPVGTVSGKARRPVNLVAVPVSAPAAAEVEAEGEAEAEGNANTAPPPTLPPANDPTETEAAKQAPIRLPNPNPPASTNPSSFTAHSATTTSTSVTPPDITISAPSPPPPTTMLTTTAAASFPEANPDSEGPIVLAEEVLPASAAVKPPMERFVTAVEDLHLHSASPQVNGVVA